MALKYDGILRAYKLKPNHVPVTLDGLVDVIERATCEDYLRAGQALGTHFHIEEIFAGQNRFLDFDEVELGASSWQPKLDAIQEQIDDLDSTYAQDAEVVAAFATQIAASGDVFTLVTNKVAVETSRAQTEEGLIQADVDANESTATADRQSIRGDFATADTVVSDSVAAEAVLARQKEAEIQADVDANESAATLDRQDIRDDYVAADLVVSNSVVAEATLARLKEGEIQADVDANESTATADRLDIRADYVAADTVVSDSVVAEAATARAKETENTNAIAAEKARIDVIVNLPAAALNNFAAIEQAYTAADNAADSALTQLITSKVAVTDLDSLVTAVDSVEANTLKRSNADNDARYYQRADVDSAVGLRVLQTAFDTAIGDRQTTAAQEAAYRKISDSYLKSDVDTAVGLRVLQTDFDTAIGDRQTTAAQEAAYRKITDSYLKSDVDSAVGLRVLQTAFDTAIGDRQTTAAQEAAYRKKTDSYTKTEVDTRDGLRVLQSVYDPAIAARQTTAAQEAAYRKIADSYTKSEVYTQAEADAEFHTQTYVAAQLALKQAVVGDDHLAISHTTGLTAALAGKQGTVGDDDLALAHTSGLVSALAGKQAVVTDDDLAISHTSGLQTALDARISNTGAQSVTHNSTSAVLTLNNATADQMHLNCIGADGHIRLIGGNVLECTRDGGMTIRCNNTNSSVNIQSRGSNKIVCDDKARFKTAAVAEDDFTVEGSFVASKAVPATASTAGTTGEIRWDASYLYFCVGPTTWKRISTGIAW